MTSVCVDCIGALNSLNQQLANVESQITQFTNRLTTLEATKTSLEAQIATAQATAASCHDSDHTRLVVS